MNETQYSNTLKGAQPYLKMDSSAQFAQKQDSQTKKKKKNEKLAKWH